MRPRLGWPSMRSMWSGPATWSSPRRAGPATPPRSRRATSCVCGGRSNSDGFDCRPACIVARLCLAALMDLETARRHIQTCLERMRACYLQPVFDEWAILTPPQAGGVIAYSGPRPDVFRRQLPTDAEDLRQRAAGRE